MTTATPMHPAPTATGGAHRPSAKPILLLTFNTALSEPAIAFAINSAIELGAQLIVCDGIPVHITQPGLTGLDQLRDPTVSQQCQDIVTTATAAGVTAYTTTYHNPRPVRAAAQAIRQQHPGLLVFGADPARFGRRRYNRTLQRLTQEAPCLVWPPT